MSAFDLTLPFLGHRSYIQGGTLFEGLIGFYPDATEIGFKIGQMITTDRVRVEESERHGSERPAANLFLKDRGGAPVRLVVYPLPRSQAPRREPYDESVIVSASRFGSNKATVASLPGVSTVKAMVALNKALLLRVLSPGSRGQWLFTRLNIALYPESFEQLSVQYRTRSTFAAVLSDVSTDSLPLGRIMFSWWAVQ
jgi:hypothetical protein